MIVSTLPRIALAIVLAGALSAASAQDAPQNAPKSARINAPLSGRKPAKASCGCCRQMP